MARQSKATKPSKQEEVDEVAELDALEEQEANTAEDLENEAEEAELESEEEVDEVAEKPAKKSTPAKKASKESEARFKFERVMSPKRDKTLLRVHLDGKVQPYYGVILNAGKKADRIIEIMSKQDPVKVSVPLGINQRKGKHIHEMAVNGVGFILPKGVYLNLPETLGNIIEESFNQTAEAGTEYLLENNPARAAALA